MPHMADKDPQDVVLISLNIKSRDFSGTLLATGLIGLDTGGKRGSWKLRWYGMRDSLRVDSHSQMKGWRVRSGKPRRPVEAVGLRGCFRLPAVTTIIHLHAGVNHI